MAIEVFEDIILTSKTGVWLDSRAYASLNALVADLGDNVGNIVIAQDEVIASNLILSSKYVLHFQGPLAKITPDTGVTVTVNTNKIIAPARQIFDGLGDFTFADNGVYKSSWFADLSDAFTRLATVTCALMITASEVVGEDLVVPSTMILSWEAPGNIITLSSTFELSAVHTIVAGQFQIFAGAGDISFTRGMRLVPQWFNSFREMINKIGTDEVEILITRREVVDLTTTVPATTFLSIVRGAGFSVSDSQVLTINCNGVVRVDDDSWYDGLGTTTVNGNIVNLTEVYATEDNIYDIINGGPGVIDPGKLTIGAATTFEAGYDSGQANIDATQALADAAVALADAATAQGTADGKVQLFRQSAPPSGAGESEGDLWIDTDDNKTYTYVGAAWVYDENSDLALALSRSTDAINDAAVKTTAFLSLSTIDPIDPEDGDLWYQTDTTQMYMWDEGAAEWKIAATSNEVTIDTVAPTDPTVGDQWLDSANGILYIWDGAAWVGAGDFTKTVIDGGLITTGSIVVADGGGVQQAGMTGNESAGDDVRIWAGDTLANRTIAPFRVYQSGKLYAQNDSEFGIPLGTVEVPTSKGIKYTQSSGLLEIFGSIIATENLLPNSTTFQEQEVNVEVGSIPIPPGSALEDPVTTFDFESSGIESIKVDYNLEGLLATLGTPEDLRVTIKLILTRPDLSEDVIENVVDTATGTSITTTVTGTVFKNLLQVGTYTLRSTYLFEVLTASITAFSYNATDDIYYLNIKR